MKMKSKRSEAKNCLSSKNVHLCLLTSVKRRKKGVRRMRGQSTAKRKIAYQAKMSTFVYLTL